MAFGRHVQEDLDTLQLNESIPYVSIVYIRRRSRLRGQKTGRCWKQTAVCRSKPAQKLCQRSVGERRRKFEVARNVVWKSTDFLRRIVASHGEAGSVILSYHLTENDDRFRGGSFFSELITAATTVIFYADVFFEYF